MKKLLVIIALLAVTVLSGRAYTDDQARSYIEMFKATALANEQEYGIPAPIILAQGILESGAGQSSLTRQSNNHFGIKAGSRWSGPVYRAWDDEPQKSRFRSYASAAESYRDHARLLTTNPVYRNLFLISVYDYRGWAYGLKRAGYATAPHYAEALIGIIDRYRLYAVNGGAKLRPGRKVVITRYVDVQKEVPVFEEDDIIADDVETEEEASVADVMVRYVVEINDVPCTLLQPGETLGSVARRYDISPARLLEYNELASERQLEDGDIIFLDYKKKKYDGPRDVYIAKKGETLHDVSQEFGIRLDRLAKLNNRQAYSTLGEGERIWLK